MHVVIDIVICCAYLKGLGTTSSLDFNIKEKVRNVSE